jgi:hypothetical protein
MPRDITVTFEDGSTHVYRGAPDGVTPEQVAGRASKDFGKAVAGLDGGRPAASAPSGPGQGSRARAQQASANILGDTASNLVRGTLRGAKDVIDTGAEALAGGWDSLTGGNEGARVRAMNADGRAQYAQSLSGSGIGGGAGRLIGQTVATLPIGGAVAAPLKLAARAGVAPSVLAPVAEAVGSAGMRTGLAPTTLAGRAGNMATRMAGGAINGGASAAMVDPQSAGAGAAVGAALPPVLKGAGLAARVGVGVARGVRDAMSPTQVTAARELADALGVSVDELPATIAQLRAAQTLVPGAKPTVAQALPTPQSAILSRVVHDSPGGRVLQQTLIDQEAARGAALGRVQPTAAGKTAGDAAESLGRTAADEAGAWRDMLKQAARDQYNSPALQGVQLALPDKAAVADAVGKFFPGQAFAHAPGDLRSLAGRLQTGEPVSIQEFDALRKLAGNRARDLADSDRTASAAWGAVRGLFDDAEQAAIAKSGALKPTGQGPFGPVYGGLSGDPENAVAHLLRTGKGEVPGAALHPFAGPIDLVAGDAKMGLKHIEAHGRDQVLRGLPGVLQDGAWYGKQATGPNRTYLGDPANEAVLRMEWDGSTKQWMPTAYERTAKNRFPLETGRTTHWADAASGQSSPGNQAGIGSLPDLEASFQAFDHSLNPPPPLRDPRRYTGALEGAVPAEAGQALASGRAVHAEKVRRFEQGPFSYAWRTGGDGLPMAQGAELGKRLVNGGSSQVADAQALKGAVLERGPTMQAARDYALADLIERSTNRDTGKVLSSRLRANIDARAGMLQELLTPQQWQALNALSDDASRATEAAGRAVSGSKTYQSSANALRVGLLGSPALHSFLQRIPKVGGYASAIATGAAAKVGEQKAERLAGLLADPTAAAEALQRLQPSPAGRAVRGLLDMGDNAWSDPLPLIDISLGDLMRRGGYRAAPLLPAGGDR